MSETPCAICQIIHDPAFPCLPEDVQVAGIAALRAEVERLTAESVQVMARHYGCGEHVSFNDAWRWLAERVEVVRELQQRLESHKSNAATAGGALLDRVADLKYRAEQAEAALVERETALRGLVEARLRIVSGESLGLAIDHVLVWENPEEDGSLELINGPTASYSQLESSRRSLVESMSALLAASPETGAEQADVTWDGCETEHMGCAVPWLLSRVAAQEAEIAELRTKLANTVDARQKLEDLLTRIAPRLR